MARSATPVLPFALDCFSVGFVEAPAECRFHFGGSHPLVAEERVPVEVESGARSRVAKSALRDNDAPVLAHDGAYRQCAEGRGVE